MQHQQQQQNCDEEQRFLFGAKKIRCYGSIYDLNSPSSSSSSTSIPKISRVVLHKVQPTDTLQSLELRYNSSMAEIRRLNKLWSNQSLYCKQEVLIPIFDNNSSESGCASAPSSDLPNGRMDRQDGAAKAGKEEEESLDQLLKRIDLSMKRTKKAVKRLHRRRESPPPSSQEE